MKKIFGFLFIIYMYIWATPSWAQLQRSISLELEKVEDATEYEIELTSNRTKNTTLFRMKNPEWTANIRTGLYSLRLRSYDKRGVPGAWSESMPFTVQMPAPKILAPNHQEEIKTKEAQEFKVDLAWEENPNIKNYRIDIQPEIGDPITKTSKESRLKIDLPVAKTYTWTVTPIMEKGEDGESTEPSEFTLVGAPLSRPEIERPEDIFVQNLKWKKSDHAEHYTYALSKLGADGTWERLVTEKDYKSNSIPFFIEYPGGKYTLAVRAYGTKREASPRETREFEVYTGDRTPAAVEEAKLRASLEKPTPLYVIASWLYTRINYQARYNVPNDYRKTTYKVPGGTGRLGLGYISPKSNMGGYGVIDLTGMTVENDDGTTYNGQYASAEGHLVWRYTWGRNMLRASTGLFYKEILETTNQNDQAPKFDNAIIAIAGPHLGFDFWRPFTSKIGIQFNTRLYYGLLGVETPNGEDINPQLSYQYGLMGSYKIKQHITGFAGYAYRLEHANYNAKEFLANTPSRAQDIKIQGGYLNLLLEWGF